MRRENNQHKGIKINKFSIYVVMHALFLHKEIIFVIVVVALFLINVYDGFKTCPSLLETAGICIPTQNFRDFSLFTAASSNKRALCQMCISCKYSLQRYR
jgi:hypothetical protein